jgi:hypothetical protein
MTMPAPSLPTGMAWPSRAAMAFIAPSGIRAVATLRAPVPELFNVSRSAAPNSSPISDGLMGAASTRTVTSSLAGAGVATVASAISSVPSALMHD